MNVKTGLWIDHRKAVIAVVSGGKEKLNVIESKVDKQLGRYDGVRSTSKFDRLQVPADDSHDRGFMNEINKYYDKVVAAVRDAESILIFGPGEAKGELKKRLEKNKLAGRIVAVETADKMTDHQIEAKVREYYNVKVPPSRKGAATEVSTTSTNGNRESLPSAIKIKAETRNLTGASKSVSSAEPLQNKVKSAPKQEDVAKLAYLIYLNEGCPQGRSLEHWTKAESQLKTSAFQ